jgi:hypothetical protein
MNAELEQWINAHAQPLYFHDDDNAEGYDGRAIMVSELEKLFAGKVLVPVDALREVIRISDRDHEAWDAVKAALAASQEQGKGDESPAAPQKFTDFSAMDRSMQCWHPEGR